MSAIDDDITRFFDRMMSLRCDVERYEEWMKDYESKRPNYPAWETKDGNQLWIYEIEDEHLANLIPFIKKQDPENKTHWLDVFKAEKMYRWLRKRLPVMKAEILTLEKVAEICL